MKDVTVARAGTLAVLIYALINVGHAWAHQDLGVGMSRWQNAFILVVLGLAPIAAAVLLWTAHARVGVLLLGGSMAAALVFGSYFHYIAVSPDHVAHLPDGDLQGLFRSTALLLLISQLFGIGVAAWGSRRLRQAEADRGL